MKTIAMVLSAVVLLTACGGGVETEANDEATYIAASTSAVDDYTEAMSALAEHLSNIKAGDEGWRSEALQLIDDVSDAARAIRSLEAPERFQPSQNKMNEAMNKALEAMVFVRRGVEDLDSDALMRSVALLEEASLLVEAATALLPR